MLSAHHRESKHTKCSAANQSKGLVAHIKIWMDCRNKTLKEKSKKQNEIFNIYHLHKLKCIHTKGSWLLTPHSLENKWIPSVRWRNVYVQIDIDILKINDIYIENTFFLQMLMNARLFLGYAREETASIQWALLNANVLLVTSRVKLLRNVKVRVSILRDMSNCWLWIQEKHDFILSFGGFNHNCNYLF